MFLAFLFFVIQWNINIRTIRERYTHGIWWLFHLPPSEILIDFELFVFERDILKQRYGC
jgi:hypothetical protein